MTSLVETEDLLARLDFEPDDTERRVAETAVLDASVLACFYGNPLWDESTAPPMAKTLVLRAAKRYMDNPQGYTTSRAGDETLMWHDADRGMGIVHFTEDEQKMLERLAGRGTPFVGTVPLTAWSSRVVPRDGFVDIQGTDRRFPLFRSQDGPW